MPLNLAVIQPERHNQPHSPFAAFTILSNSVLNSHPQITIYLTSRDSRTYYTRSSHSKIRDGSLKKDRNKTKLHIIQAAVSFVISYTLAPALRNKAKHIRHQSALSEAPYSSDWCQLGSDAFKNDMLTCAWYFASCAL